MKNDDFVGILTILRGINMIQNLESKTKYNQQNPSPPHSSYPVPLPKGNQHYQFLC